MDACGPSVSLVVTIQNLTPANTREDLLIAIGYALARTRGTSSGSANIQIVLSVAEKDVVKNTQDGWGDALVIDDFKERLRMIMKAMAVLDQFAKDNGFLNIIIKTAAAIKGIPLDKIKEVGQSAQVFPAVTPIPVDEIDKAIKEQIVIKRTLLKDGNPAAIYNHSKVVVVDDHLMYVGSDNIYPSYSAERGVWVDDQEAIKKWKEGFFNGLWDRSYVPK
jgi:phosphatidylserine/phosphatidylglycerophosphate/cardiolipin synthase-like enzyme